MEWLEELEVVTAALFSTAALCPLPPLLSCRHQPLTWWAGPSWLCLVNQRLQMATQMAQKPLFETGMQVHASQLHGPALVLLGDAAHAVSPGGQLQGAGDWRQQGSAAGVPVHLDAALALLLLPCLPCLPFRLVPFRHPHPPPRTLPIPCAATSNGMNSALEDSLVLSQVRFSWWCCASAFSPFVFMHPALPPSFIPPIRPLPAKVLEACDGDLSALPPRYTAARLEDARALLWLDSAMSALVGRGPQSAALKASVVARLLLHKASGGWVAQHGFVQFKDGTLPYAEARRQVERDMAAATVVTAGAGLALAAAAAVQAMRFGQR